MDLKVTSIFLILLLMLIAQSGQAWEVDFSRRQKSQPEKFTTAPDIAQRSPATDVLVKSVHKKPKVNVDRQEIVILNTEKGFVPSNIQVHKGRHYSFHVVNINEDKKNVSFVMDAFDQHHATYFGQVQTFDLDPDKEGVFSFECPETAVSGKVVVFNQKSSSQEEIRTPASEP